MNDYGKVSEFLARTGRALPKVGKKPVRVPAAWTGNAREWEACMVELGFEECDDNRWCASSAPPNQNAFGWCVIVALETDGFAVHLTVDTEENEQDSPWVRPTARYATPLEAAQVVHTFRALGALR